MFKNHKLSESEDFQRVFKQNKSLRDRYWLILYRPNGLEVSRLGMAVAKKNVKQAVQRNRIKRIIRESFRKKKEDIAGVDVVVLARQGVCKESNRALNTAIVKQWNALEHEFR